MKKTREKMTQWIQKVAEAREIHCEVEHEDNRNIIRMGFRLNSAVSAVNVVIVAEENCFQCYGFIDNNAGKRLAEVGEYLMRANMNDLGHFSLDYDDGQISYEFRSPYCAYEKDEDLDILWLLPVTRFEDYGDGLLKIILGCATAKDAYEECINKSEETDASKTNGEVEEKQ